MKSNTELLLDISGLLIISAPVIGHAIKRTITHLPLLQHLFRKSHVTHSNNELTKSSLDEVNEILIELKNTVEHVRNSEADKPCDLKEANECLDVMTQSIISIVDETSQLSENIFRIQGETANTPTRFTLPTTLAKITTMWGPPEGNKKRAHMFMLTGETIDLSGQSFTLKLRGNRGSQGFTLASSTTQSDIIYAFNQFVGTTGIHAIQDHIDPAFVRLSSEKKGRKQFVSARKIMGSPHLNNIFYDEYRSNPANLQFDFGE